MKKRTARIFTHELCQEVDGVIDQLRLRDVAVERVNLCQFPGKLRLALDDTIGSECRGEMAGWIHDSACFSFERHLTGLAREVALEECNAFTEGLLLRQHCNWLNDPRAIQIASNKPYQLRLAAQLNIPIPPYVITNDVRALKLFQQKHGAVVVKTLSAAFIQYGNKALKFYTRRAEALGDGVLAGLSFAPVIAQKEILRTHEVRVTVVDSRCFSVAVDCRHLPQGIVDVRQLDYRAQKDRFSPLRRLPKIESWSRTFVAALGLNYAGLDWAVTEEGKAFLFEANPLASFKWFEMVGAGDITKAITAALLRRT